VPAYRLPRRGSRKLRPSLHSRVSKLA